MIPSSFANTNPKDSKLGSHIFPLMLMVLSKLAKFGIVILMCRQIIQLFSILVPDIAGFFFTISSFSSFRPNFFISFTFLSPYFLIRYFRRPKTSATPTWYQ